MQGQDTVHNTDALKIILDKTDEQWNELFKNQKMLKVDRLPEETEEQPLLPTENTRTVTHLQPNEENLTFNLYNPQHEDLQTGKDERLKKILQLFRETVKHIKPEDQENMSLSHGSMLLTLSDKDGLIGAS